MVVESVHADAAGDEYVVFGNEGDQVLNLGEWTVSDASGHTYTIPEGVTLAPGETLTLHSGQGEDTSTDLYWGAAAPIWNNGGDTVTVTNADGDRVRTYTY